MEFKTTPQTVEDIDRLIAGQVSESEELEFKQALSTADGSPDVWMTGSVKIGKIAKRELAKEIIAFANSRGGTLVLGIGEDGEKRAATKHPVPRCRDLADRLAQSIASSVDPMLASLEAWGIELDESGSGFVVFRVPSSFRAPHRDKDERECYRRVGDRSEPMDMRSIQDLVVQRARGVESIREALDVRSRILQSRLKPMVAELPAGQRSRLLQPCLVRATAVPLEPINISGFANSTRFHFRQPGLHTRRSLLQSTRDARWTPILRGIRSAEDRSRVNRTILASGLVETTCDEREQAVTSISPAPVGFPLEFIIITAANTILLAAALRTRLGRPDLEFAVDVEWRLPLGAKLLLPLERQFADRTLEPIEPNSRVSDYVMPSNDALPSLLAMIEEDVQGSFGRHFGRLFDIDLGAALEDIMA